MGAYSAPPDPLVGLSRMPMLILVLMQYTRFMTRITFCCGNKSENNLNTPFSGDYYIDYPLTNLLSNDI